MQTGHNCSKTKYARTYHKGARAALNDRRTAEKILMTMEDLKNERKWNWT